MKYIISLLILISTLLSCNRYSILSIYKDNIKICYTGENIGADSSININGYYEMSLLEKNSNKISNRVYNYIFFEDGQFYFDINTTKQGSPVSFIEKMSNGLITNKNLGDNYNSYWGTYFIKEDTIIAQAANINPSVNARELIIEKYFKIIDKNTIEYICSKSITNDSLQAPFFEKKGVSIGKFIPYKVFKSPNTRLKNKKWFWCKDAWEREKLRKQNERLENGFDHSKCV